MKPGGWEVVEDKQSPDGTQSACLWRKRVVNNTVYRFKAWKGSEQVKELHLYGTNEAFNALEHWEVSVGILPKSYDPEAI